MAAFYDNNITDVGRIMLAEVEMGAVFTPTRIVVGSGYLPQGTTTKTIKNVVTPVKSMSLNKKVKQPNGDVVFGCVFSNEEITEPFYFRELALYAKAVRSDGSETEETLYSYGNAGTNAELIAAYSTSTAVERQLDLIVFIGNDAAVNLTIESGIYATKEEVRKIGKQVQASGTGTAIILTADGAPELSDGDSYSFKLPFDIGDNATLSFNGGEALPVYVPDGSQVSEGFAVTGAFAQVTYNEDLKRWYLTGGGGGGGSAFIIIPLDTDIPQEERDPEALYFKVTGGKTIPPAQRVVTGSNMALRIDPSPEP